MPNNIGRRIYGASTTFAFLTGCMPFIPVLSAAAFAGFTSPFGLVSLIITAAWVIASFIPLFFLDSSTRFPFWCAIASTFTVLLLCGGGLVSLSKGKQVDDPLYFTSPISEWAWLSLPLLFNTMQAVLTVFRYQQFRTAR